MKCINKKLKLFILLGALSCISILLFGCQKEEELVEYASQYEADHYDMSLYQGQLFSKNLCVTDTDIALEGFAGDTSLHASGLFDVSNQEVIYADKMFEQLYPASTTKLMTALLVLRYGNFDDTVTVSENATNFAADEQTCGLQTGDQISMYDLFCGLMLYSGNDTAVAIAEHMSGSVEEFAKLMNEEANRIGATQTNFVNPHGLHHKDHKTTAYDLYLIFNECCKDQRFLDVISQKSYNGTMTGADGSVRTEKWDATHYYAHELAYPPEGVTVLGGKTGTTDEAGACVILYNQDAGGNPYISIVMGASDKTILYNDMTKLLDSGISNSTAEN